MITQANIQIQKTGILIFVQAASVLTPLLIWSVRCTGAMLECPGRILDKIWAHILYLKADDSIDHTSVHHRLSMPRVVT